MKCLKSKKTLIALATMCTLGTSSAYSAEWREARAAFKDVEVLIPEDPIAGAGAMPVKSSLIDVLDDVRALRKVLPASHHLKAAERNIKRAIMQFRKLEMKVKDPEESE